MRHKFATLLACSPSERLLLGEAWLFLLGTGTALRVMPLPRVQALLHRMARSRPPRRAWAISADRLAWLVGAAARHHLWSVSCLERSLVLQALLRRCDALPELRIGVRREGDTLQAHAWVEVDGRPVGDSRTIARQFHPLSEPSPG